MTTTNEYEKPDWAADQIVRTSWLVEDVCEHGVGHPNIAWLQKYDPNGNRGYGIHGCDGCCNKKEDTHDHDCNDSE